MATWKADIKTTPTGSIYSVTVEAGASYVAKQEIERLYNPIFVRNLHQVRNNSSSSSSGGDGSGAIGLVGLVAAGWAFMSFTPWILMLVGGAGAAWLSQKVVGQTIEEYTERNDDKGHIQASIVLASALIVGGIGFVKGDEIKKGFDAPTDIPAQVQQAK